MKSRTPPIKRWRISSASMRSIRSRCCSTATQPNYNRLYRKIEAIEAELKRRGLPSRRALLVLLDDPNLRVRYEAARRLLAVDRYAALTALNEIVASHQMPEAGDAGMTPQFLEDGVFKPRLSKVAVQIAAD
jgi:uncharacterized protein DUF2019